MAPKAGINLKVRRGINTGRVIAGNLGTRTRIEHTVIGAAVNLSQCMDVYEVASKKSQPKLDSLPQKSL